MKGPKVLPVLGELPDPGGEGNDREGQQVRSSVLRPLARLVQALERRELKLGVGTEEQAA